MLFNSDGSPLICPILAPEEHTVKPDFVRTITGEKSGWASVAR